VARPSLTEEEVDRFREEAARVALEMVDVEGVESVTLRALATRLGCSYAKPYRYFGDKEDLLDCARGLAFDLLGEFMGAELAAWDPIEGSPPAEIYLRFALERPEVYRLLFAMRQEKISDRTREAQARAWEVCSRPYREGVAAGELVGDPELIAHVAWASIHGLACLALSGQLYLGKTVEEIAVGLGSVIDGFRPGAVSRA
jgi:AcrR family transcriptional regulator